MSAPDGIAGEARFIVVEGPIGVGKTTLARRLADSFGTDLILEAADDNPFLARFYQSPRRYALQTQLHFLMQRVEQLRQVNQADLFRPVQVADYLMDKDRLFARLNLDHDEMRLYEAVYSHLAADIPQPDLVIYLQAPVTQLLRRIARRGIDYEQRIGADYLEQLCASYVEFFYHYDGAPMLIVNTEEINLADNDEHLALLLDRIKDGVVGKQYFNPAVC